MTNGSRRGTDSGVASSATTRAARNSVTGPSVIQVGKAGQNGPDAPEQGKLKGRSMKVLATICSAQAFLLLAVLGAGLAGCGGSGGADAADGSALLYSCKTETRAVPYEPGLSRPSTAGQSTIVLLTSEPGPPVKGSNDWTIEILDTSGAPESGLAITAKPFMPDHGHGTSVTPVITPVSGKAGTYLVSPLYLYMPGYWEVTFTWQPATGAEAGSAVFPICIPG